MTHMEFAFTFPMKIKIVLINVMKTCYKDEMFIQR